MLNAPTGPALSASWLHVGALAGGGLLLNALLFRGHLGDPARLAPSHRDPDPLGPARALLISGLLWPPLVPLALGSRAGVLAGNLGTVVLAGYLVAGLWPRSPWAAARVLLTVAWVLLTTAAWPG